jgi:hypothetical protein
MGGRRVDETSFETTVSTWRRDPESREVGFPFGVGGAVRERVHR